PEPNRRTRAIRKPRRPDPKQNSLNPAPGTGPQGPGFQSRQPEPDGPNRSAAFLLLILTKSGVFFYVVCPMKYFAFCKMHIAK
ncbi:MAG: hypothetical protein ACI4VM_00440, partial [Anaerovoracaceae bacterium]